jgi:FkbM family methyltransferase
MFNNCDSKTNGEYKFFDMIKNNIDTIFDIGCRQDSEFLEFTGTVHYFDPNYDFIKNLSKQESKNNRQYFNDFGLFNTDTDLFYYPKYQSFFDRTESCKESDDKNKIRLKVRKASDYIRFHKIDKIDFIKIDTEGSEFNVIKGFEDYIRSVNIIQFEYGGTYKDSNIKLKDLIEYLKKYDFYKFSYLTNNGPVEINNFDDHYQYCNIVCINKLSKFQQY